MAKVGRFLEYRRALWFSDVNDIEAQLRLVWGRLSSNRDRIIERSDGASVMGMRHRDFGQNGIAIHCAKYVERQGVGVVSMVEVPSSNLAERRPGNDENFLNSDFMALIKGEHVITLGAGQNAAALRSYLHGLFLKGGLHEDATKFDIVRVGNAGTLARIAANGVASVGLNVAIDEATSVVLDEQRRPRTVFQKLSWPVSSMVDAVVGAESKASQISDSRKGSVKVLLSVPGSDLETAQSGLDGIAEELFEDEDAHDYLITLRNGETIKPGELAVKKHVRLEKEANTVDIDEVWDELNTFMSELRNSGQLEA